MKLSGSRNKSAKKGDPLLSPSNSKDTLRKPQSPKFEKSDVVSASPSKALTAKTRSIFDDIGSVAPEIIEQRLKDRLPEMVCESPKNQEEAYCRYTVYMNMKNSSLSSFSVQSISQKMVCLNLSGVSLRSMSIPSLPRVRMMILEHCKIKSLDGFQQFPSLEYLSLANNRLTNCTGFLPSENLRYLSLKNNKLSSFEGIQVCANLEELCLSGNVEEFPPELAIAAMGTLSLMNLDDVKITEAQTVKAFSMSPLVGMALRQGMPLSVINEDEDFPEFADEQVDIISMKANAFLAREFRSYLPEANRKVSYLHICEEKGEISMTLPVRNIKWFINHMPCNPDDEWECISKWSNGNVLRLNQMMYQHLVKCEFQLPASSKVYSVYTLTVIGAREGEMMLPFPVNPKVVGDPLEGTLISLIPVPIPVNISWFAGREQINSTSTAIKLDKTHVGHEIACVLEPYCAHMPNIKFIKLMTKTNVVMALSPVVSGIVFPKDVIEGVEIRFSHNVFPKREGDSIIYLEKASSASGNWEKVTQLQKFSMVYTPRAQDLNCFLRISYLPLLDDEYEIPEDRNPVYFYSTSRVAPGVPKFTHPMIAGDLRYGHPVLAAAEYSGGNKGECVYTWYTSTKPLTTTKPFENQKGAHRIEQTSPILKLRKEMQGLYLGVEMHPVRDDDMIGEKVSAVTDTPIGRGGRLAKLDVPDKVAAFAKINVGKSVYWSRSNTTWTDADGQNTGFEKITVGPEYTPTQADVGRFLRLQTKDESMDVIIGEVASSVPFIYNFSLNLESALVGSTAVIPPEVFGVTGTKKSEYAKVAADELGSAIKTEVVWLRVRDGYDRVVDIDTHEYTFTKDDVGAQIKAVVYPLDYDNNRCTPTESEPTPVIKARKIKPPKIVGVLKQNELLNIEMQEPVYSVVWQRSGNNKGWENAVTYTYNSTDADGEIWYDCDAHDRLVTETSFRLTKKDIDKLIRVEVTVGEWNGQDLVKSDMKPVHAVDPLTRVERKSLTLKVSANLPVTQGETVDVRFDGRLPSGKQPTIVWETLEDEEEDTWVELHKGASYDFKKADVGKLCRVRCLETGEIFELEEVQSIVPVVEEVLLTQDSEGTISISTKYRPGTEGMTRYYVSYVSPEDNATLDMYEIEDLVVDNGCHKFTPWKEIFGKRIDVACIPIRGDDIGECCWSKTSIVVKPLPLVHQASFIPESLTDVTPGSSVKCSVLKSSLAQEFTFQWYRVSLDAPNSPMTHIGKGDTYTITEKDNNSELICQITAVGQNGCLSPTYIMRVPVSLMTDQPTLTIAIPKRKVTQSPKRQSDVSFARDDKVFTGDILKPLFNGDTDVADLEVTWERQLKNDQQDPLAGWTEIAYGPEYQPTVEDVDYMIRCRVETSDDEYESPAVGPVSMNPSVLSVSNAVVKSNSFKFKAKAVIGAGQWDISFGPVVVLKSRTGQEQRIDWSSLTCRIAAAANQLEMVTGPASRFIVTPSLCDKRLSDIVPKNQVRDFIVHVCTEFKQKFNKM